MNLRTIVWKELWERPSAMITSVLAIVLGVASLVAIRHVTVYSEREVGRQLESLGANILILPQGASIEDYYSADANGRTMPETHAAGILLANLTGVEKLSPKLAVPTTIGERPVTLVGILPQSEFQAKAAWQSVSLFSKNKHAGCKKAACGPKADAGTPASLVTERTIDDLRPTEAVVGAELAGRMKLKAGDTLELFGEPFKLLAVLPPAGTVDDSRVFAHLHRVQQLAKTGEVVSAIEVLGCCEDAAGQLVPQLGALLPDTRVTTISQVVDTQIGVNRLMARSSLFVLAVLVVVGGASVSSAIASNVRERRREIGTLMALGATPGLVSRLFLLKATWLGLLGGGVGATLGVALAVWGGPRWAGVTVAPLPDLFLMACATAVTVTLVAAWWPARQAARLDPCSCFQEV